MRARFELMRSLFELMMALLRIDEGSFAKEPTTHKHISNPCPHGSIVCLFPAICTRQKEQYLVSKRAMFV